MMREHQLRHLIHDKELLTWTKGQRRKLRRMRIMSARDMRHALKRAQRRAAAESRWRAQCKTDGSWYETKGREQRPHECSWKFLHQIVVARDMDEYLAGTGEALERWVCRNDDDLPRSCGAQISRKPVVVEPSENPQ